MGKNDIAFILKVTQKNSDWLIIWTVLATSTACPFQGECFVGKCPLFACVWNHFRQIWFVGYTNKIGIELN